MGDDKATQSNSLGAQSSQAADAMQILSRLMGQSQSQLGDLSGLAGGNIGINDSDRMLADEASTAAAEIARRQAERDYETMSRQTEDSLVGSGVDSSTIDAVVRALQGRQYQQQLGDIGLKRQENNANLLSTLPFQRAETQISANQAILNRILGGSQGILDYDIKARLGSGTSETSKSTGWGTMFAQGLGQAVGAAARSQGVPV